MKRDSALLALALQRGWIRAEQVRPDLGAADLLSAEQIAELGRERELVRTILDSGFVRPGDLLATDKEAERATVAEAWSPDAGATNPSTRTRATADTEAGRPFGKYLLLAEIGRGGMGVVYRAMDSELRREVAIKTLPVDAAGDPTQIQRLLREARTAATLAHPGIPAIHDVGVVDGVPYFAMALVRGRTLDQVLGLGPLGQRERATIVHAAAQAVAHAHERNVIHRDLKPGNIMIEDGGRVHVMDFGLAKLMDQRTRLTHTGQMMGTPSYMPPEQIEGELDRIGPHTDVYGLGAVLYFSLTGRAPFEGGTLEHVVAQALQHDPRPPRLHDPGIHVDLNTICLKALEKEPERRYRDAREFAQDLARYLAGEPIQAAPVSRVRRWRRTAGRHKGVALTIALAALVCLGLGLRMWTNERRRARGVEAHMAEARGHREAGRAQEARDAYQRAGAMAVGMGDAKREAETGLAWADAELERLAAIEKARADVKAAEEKAAAEKAASRAAVNKQRLIRMVIVRWATVRTILVDLERLHADLLSAPDDKRKQVAALWPRVAAFMQGTPEDATSQATMLALAGWARFLAGQSDGMTWMKKAQAQDQDVPLGAMLEALACLSDYVELHSSGEWGALGACGTTFFDPERETSAMKELSERIGRLLVAAKGASLLSGEMQRQFSCFLLALQALWKERLPDAESRLTETLDSRLTVLFRTAPLLLRARVRFLMGRPTEAAADLEELVRSWPGHMPSFLCLGRARTRVAEEAVRKGAKPETAYGKAVAAFEAVVSRCKGEDASSRCWRVAAHYHLARIEAILAAASGSEAERLCDAAFAQLERARALGWSNPDALRQDGGFAALHDDPRWREWTESRR